MRSWRYPFPPFSVPFQFNRDSPQAEGLQEWYVAASAPWRKPLRDLVQGVDFSGLSAGAVQWIGDARLGWCWQFDGDDYQGIDELTPVANLTRHTVAVWFRIPVSPATEANLYGEGRSTGNNPLLMLKVNNAGVAGDVRYLHRSDAAVSSGITYAGGVNDNQPHLMVGVKRAANLHELFLDGISRGTETTSVGTTTINRRVIGALLQNTASAFLTGLISEVRVYTRDLTAAEIADLYDPATRWELYAPLIPIFPVVKPVVTPVELSGTTSLTFAASAALQVEKPLAGASSLIFSPSAALQVEKPLAGASSLIFSPTGVLQVEKPLSGSSPLTFGVAGSLLVEKSLAGTTSLTFLVTGDLHVGSGMTGTAALTFAASGNLQVEKPLSGSTLILFTPQGLLQVEKRLSGAAALVFGLSGNLLSIVPDLPGYVTSTVEPAGGVAVTVEGAGGVTVTVLPMDTEPPGG